MTARNPRLEALLGERDTALAAGDWRAAVVAEARSFMHSPGTDRSTPFGHQGRSKWFRADCIGLFVLSARACGRPCGDHTRYSRYPRPELLLEHMRMSFDEVRGGLDRAEDACVGLFSIWRPDIPQHGALLCRSTDGGHDWAMVHTYDDVRVGSRPGRVVENGLDGQLWLPRLHSVWRLKGA